MSFGASIRTVLRRYAEFEGRAGRPECWWWLLFTVLVLAAIDVSTGTGVEGTSSRVGVALAGLWSIATLLPTLAVMTRRLRDAGHGWGHLFWALVPVAGVVVLAAYLAQPTRVGEPATADRPATA